MSKSPAFFDLVPVDSAAAQIVSLPQNEFFKANLSGKVCLKIGVDHNPKHAGQLISFGRDSSSCDVTLPPGFPEKQCHFFVHPRTREVLLRDDTSHGSTSLADPDDVSNLALGLPTSQPRQRVLLNTIPEFVLKMENATFILAWSDRGRAFDAAKTTSIVRESVAITSSRHLLLQDGSLIHSPFQQLGLGDSATVFKTLNLNTGSHLAVKIFHPIPGISERADKNLKREYKREAKLISRLSHVSNSILQHLYLSSAADISASQI